MDISGTGGTTSTTDIARELSQPSQFGPTVTEKIAGHAHPVAGQPGHLRSGGPSPSDQHAEIQSPTPGMWTAKFFRNANDVPSQASSSVPGSYRGTMSFHVPGQHDRGVPGAGSVRPC